MAISYGVAGLLFPAISLLMLAYTNRFLALTATVRNLVSQYKQQPSPHVYNQMLNLQKRIVLLRHIQAIGVMSLTSCTLCMFALLLTFQHIAIFLFGLALVLMVLSLLVSIVEIHLSIIAINLEIEQTFKNHP